MIVPTMNTYMLNSVANVENMNKLKNHWSNCNTDTTRFACMQ